MTPRWRIIQVLFDFCKVKGFLVATADVLNVAQKLSCESVSKADRLLYVALQRRQSLVVEIQVNMQVNCDVSLTRFDLFR